MVIICAKHPASALQRRAHSECSLLLGACGNAVNMFGETRTNVSATPRRSKLVSLAVPGPVRCVCGMKLNAQAKREHSTERRLGRAPFCNSHIGRSCVPRLIALADSANQSRRSAVENPIAGPSHLVIGCSVTCQVSAAFPATIRSSLRPTGVRGATVSTTQSRMRPC